MERVGSLMVLAGVISAVLTFFNAELRVLLWIENWGDTMAWLIRFVLIAGGAALITVDLRAQAAAAASQPHQAA
jgi:hypothetical protein